MVAPDGTDDPSGEVDLSVLDEGEHAARATAISAALSILAVVVGLLRWNDICVPYDYASHIDERRVFHTVPVAAVSRKGGEL